MAFIEQQKDLNGVPGFDGHVFVARFEDVATGLRGFVAIHNENLGPATGGTRMFPYASEADALKDVLRLSRAMTYKCAVAGVRHGGGKAVIIGDPERDKTEKLLRIYARVIEELRGRFTTGEDVGITEDDVQIMLEESRYFIGRRGVAGDPSPYAAMSTFYAMEVAAEERFGSGRLAGRSVAVKGAGKVGQSLIRLLSDAGARIVAADVNPSVIEAIRARFPAVTVAKPDVIHREVADIFSPCALGGDFDDRVVHELRTAIVCGAANNQLASDAAGDALFKKRILYVPDYVANAGGLINVVDELEPGGYRQERVLERIRNLRGVLQKILRISRERGESSARVADRIAEEIFTKKSLTK